MRGAVIGGLTCVALGAAAIGMPFAAAGQSTRSVVLKDIAFQPANLTVRRGTLVTFRWRDGSTPHNVRSRGKPRFPGSGDRTKGTHRVRFRKAGTYRYVCTIHPGMSGRIAVR